MFGVSRARVHACLPDSFGPSRLVQGGARVSDPFGPSRGSRWRSRVCMELCLSWSFVVKVAGVAVRASAFDVGIIDLLLFLNLYWGVVVVMCQPSGEEVCASSPHPLMGSCRRLQTMKIENKPGIKPGI